MINYIWLILIVIAVLFAGYKDVVDAPYTGTPDQELLLDFEDPVRALSSFPIDHDVYFVRQDAGNVREGGSAAISYDFTSTSKMAIPAEVALQKEVLRDLPGRGKTALTPDTLRLRVYGDGAGQRLWAVFADADDEEFLSPASRAIDWKGDWKQLSFSLSELEPMTNGPLVEANAPLRLKEFLLVQKQGSDVAQGTIYLDDMALAFPEMTVGSGELASNSWMGVLTKSTALWAEISITLAIELIGIMMLWLGLMRIAEKAGLVQLLAKALKPVMSRLFPDIPPEGEAMGAILMNMAANMLGLGNAATPLGLKTMEELQKLNTHKQYASNAMCMLLSVNTSSVTIIVPGVFAYRVAAGSTDIMKFWPVMIATTTTSTVVAIIACKIYEKLPIFQIPKGAPTGPEEEPKEATA